MIYKITKNTDIAEKSKIELINGISNEFNEDEDVELQAFSYTEAEEGRNGALQPIESEEEWDMVEEVLNTFLLDEDE